MDTTAHRGLISTRFAYVSISRAFGLVMACVWGLVLATEQSMTNTNDTSLEDRNRLTSTHTSSINPQSDTSTEADRQHYAPIQAALPDEASSYQWKRETGTIQSYQHTQSGGRLHLGSEGQFYDRHAHPITRETALERALHPHAQAIREDNQIRTDRNDGHGHSF